MTRCVSSRARRRWRHADDTRDPGVASTAPPASNHPSSASTLPPGDPWGDPRVCGCRMLWWARAALGIASTTTRFGSPGSLLGVGSLLRAPRRHPDGILDGIARPGLERATRGHRDTWTGAGGPTRPDGSRVGRHDERPRPPPVCTSCRRRFCRCHVDGQQLRRPPRPGPEDCCQSAPQCTFCVWIVYEQELEEYEAARVSSNPGGGGGGGGSA